MDEMVFGKFQKIKKMQKSTILEPTQICFGKKRLKNEIFFQSRKKHFIFFFCFGHFWILINVQN
jgi:hypothetical protein